jgi:DNA polymerase I-like protein with 3'-5' exonuclease and polymerase domains
MIREANDTRELRDVFWNRRREFALGEVPGTEIANYPIQASSAAIVNERGTLLYNISKTLDPSSLYLAQIHDAIIYEVAEDRAEVFAAAMTKTLTCEKSYKGSAPMLFSASASIADNMRDV